MLTVTTEVIHTSEELTVYCSCTKWFTAHLELLLNYKSLVYCIPWKFWNSYIEDWYSFWWHFTAVIVILWKFLIAQSGSPAVKLPVMHSSQYVLRWQTEIFSTPSSCTHYGHIHLLCMSATALWKEDACTNYSKVNYHSKNLMCFNFIEVAMSFTKYFYTKIFQIYGTYVRTYYIYAYICMHIHIQIYIHTYTYFT